MTKSLVLLKETKINKNKGHNKISLDGLKADYCIEFRDRKRLKS